MALLDSELFLWAIPIMSLAGLVHGVFGIGFPLVATPLLAMVTDVRTAVLLTLLPTIAINISMLIHARAEGAAVKPHWPLLLYVLLGAAFGSWLLTILDPKPFLLVLAGALLLYLNQKRLQGIDMSWVRRQPSWAYLSFGLCAGTMAGSVNVMAPVLVMLALELRLSAAAMVLLFNLNFLGGKLVQTSVFLLLGQLTPAGLIASSALAPVALAALALGLWLRSKITEQRYRGMLRALLWLMVLVLLLRFVW